MEPRRRRQIRFGLAGAAAALALAAAARADGAGHVDGAPRVARVTLERSDGRELPAPGLAFLLAVDNRAGAVGVATGSALDPVPLHALRRVRFRARARGGPAAVSRGLLVAPADSGSGAAAVRVFHLEAPPAGLAALEPQRGTAAGRALRVEVPGPQEGGRGWGRESRVEGNVVAEEGDRILVDLDAPHDLRGWEGAPVVATLTGRVVGVLEASDPRGPDRRIVALPIDRVLRDLDHPLSGGAGASFASFARGRGGASPGDGAASAPARAEGPLIRPALTPTSVRLNVEQPGDGATLRAGPCGVFVAGRSQTSAGPAKHFDVVFVIDTSGSTAAASGADIDGDGEVGHSRGATRDYLGAPSSDPGDSILAAELAAARLVLDRLDPSSTRAGVVRFAGRAGSWPGAEAPAVTQVGLTDDYQRVRLALDTIAALGPSGQTNMAAGVRQAVSELTGGPGGIEGPLPANGSREKIVLFFTDGQPTLPYALPFVHDNVATVLEAADAARAAGITFHTFALGPEALAGPLGPIELADRTGGVFTPVRQPSDLIHVVADVHLANVERVELRNLTGGAVAHQVRVNADGPWSALVPVSAGWNELEVLARASDGAQTRTTLRVREDDSAPEQAVPAAWTGQHEALLRSCLDELREANRAAERAYVDQVRKRLLVEIEAERARARERAERQRKELEITPERADHSRR